MVVACFQVSTHHLQRLLRDGVALKSTHPLAHDCGPRRQSSGVTGAVQDLALRVCRRAQRVAVIGCSCVDADPAEVRARICFAAS
jgi:hypothetical protein